MFARKNLLCWLNWFNREKIVLLIASLALFLGAIFPWYCLPTPTLEAFGTNLTVVNVGRVIAALFALIGFGFTFWSMPIRTPRLIWWSGLIVVLLFPYFITTWSPSVTFIAASYYNQNARVTQHIERNFSQIQASWKQQVILSNAQINKSVFDFSIGNSRFFQISSWDQFLIEGLGYSNNFLGLIGRGWAFTVVGFIFCLFAFYLSLKEQAFNSFLIDMGKFLPLISLIGVILVVSLVLPNIINHQLNTLLAKGQYHQVLATSRILASWYPPLSGDTEFLKRMAEAGFYGNQPDAALIYFAKGLERYRRGDLLQAEEYFQRSLDIQPKRFLVRGYLATTIVNQGVEYFNNRTEAKNRAPGVAADRFEQALQLFPGHIEALYDLMLARVVTGEFENSASVAQQLIETQQYFQTPNLSLLGQAYLHSSWDSYQNNDVLQAWQQYRQAIDKSAWNKSDKRSEKKQEAGQ